MDRKGLQSVICGRCKHYWTEDVEIVGNGVEFPFNSDQLCPECGEEFTDDDFVGDVRPLHLIGG